MRKLLFILFLFPLLCLAQRPTTYKILADSVKVTTLDASGAELILENDTQDTTYGVLTNIANGRTQFKKIRTQKLNDSLYVINIGNNVQGDTINVHEASAGAIYTLYKKGDSIVLSGSNGSRYAVRDTFQTILASNGLTMDVDTVELGGTLTSDVYIDGDTYRKAFQVDAKQVYLNAYDTLSNGQMLLLLGQNKTSNKAASSFYGRNFITTGTNSTGAEITGETNSSGSPDIRIIPVNGKMKIDSIPSDSTQRYIWTYNPTTKFAYRQDKYDFIQSILNRTSSGTVTSISQGSGITLSSNPITTTGSISADTSVLATKGYVNGKADNDQQTLSINVVNDSVKLSISNGNTLNLGRPPVDTVNLTKNVGGDSIVLNALKSTVWTRFAVKDNNSGVDTIYRTVGKDSIQFKINGQYYAIKDSTQNLSNYVTNTKLTDSLATKTNKLLEFQRSTTTDTLKITYADKVVEMNVGSANNLCVPANADVPFSIGTQILVSQYGAGQTTIVALSGVTIRSPGGKLKLTAQYSMITLIKVGTNEWYCEGDLSN